MDKSYDKEDSSNLGLLRSCPLEDSVLSPGEDIVGVRFFFSNTID